MKYSVVYRKWPIRVLIWNSEHREVLNSNAKAYNFFSTLQTHLLYQHCICNRVQTIQLSPITSSLIYTCVCTLKISTRCRPRINNEEQCLLLQWYLLSTNKWYRYGEHHQHLPMQLSILQFGKLLSFLSSLNYNLSLAFCTGPWPDDPLWK